MGPTIMRIDKKDFINYINETKNIQMIKQTKFDAAIEEFVNLGFGSNQEELNGKFQEFLTQLDKIEEQVHTFERMDIFRCFIIGHFNNTLSFLDDLMEFTSFHVSRVLYKSVNEIRGSLRENLNIQECNLNNLMGEQLEAVAHLRLQLYEKRKQWIIYNRHDFSEGHEIQEIDNSIKKAEMMLQQTHQNSASSSIEILQRAKLYFETCLKSLDEIVSTIHWVEKSCQSIRDIKEKTLNLYEDQRLRSLDCHCHDGLLAESIKNSAIRSIDEKWEEFMKEYENQLKGFNSKKEEAFKSLITWLCVKGNTRVMYSDTIGEFYLDEYGRKIYNMKDGKDIFCQNCNGELEKINQLYKCWYDNDGRFTEVSGEKLYERAAGSSRYRLSERNAMEQVCGHTDNKNVCARLLTDAEGIVRLPKINQVSMESTLSFEDVNYLWDSLGPYLPPALHAVAKLQPNNPIHYLAHRFIFDKYSATEEQVRVDKENAGQHRTTMLAKRLEERTQIEKKWKDLQMKCPAPKDTDDSQNISLHFFIMQQFQHNMQLN